MNGADRSPSAVLLKAFLNRSSPDRQKALLRFLPKEEQAEISQAPSVAIDKKMPSVLELVHWSWFIPTLKTYSPSEQHLFLKALPSTAAHNLRQELGLEETMPGTISSIASTFLQETLLSSLTGVHDRLLPPEYLPTSPLKELLHLSKKELTHLIDLLSLHDLAAELRQIVETKILKRIYSFLTEEHRKLLKVIMTQKEPFSLPRLGLEKWKGNQEAFCHLLHRRGLTRLGLALSGQHPDLLWYICHQLDIGRGNTLFKLAAKEPPPAAAGFLEVLVGQIEELLTYMASEK